MEQFKICGGDQRLRTSHLNPGSPRPERRTRNSSRRTQTSFLPTHFNNHNKMTQHWMMVKLEMISGPFQAISFTVITWNPESNCTCREKNHFSIAVKFLDVTRNTHTSSDVMLEKSTDDYWNVDGDRELSDTWTGFTRFTCLSEKPPDGFSWSGRRLTRKQTTSRPDTLWPEMWKHMSDASKSRRKAKVGSRETKTRKCQKITWYLPHWSWRRGIQAYYEKYS